MNNPFDLLEARLEKIENLLIGLQNQNTASNNVEEAFLNVQEAADLTDLQPSTIYKMVHYRKIPFFKRGGKLYFTRNSLIEWICAGKIPTTEEIQLQNDIFLSGRKKRIAGNKKVKG